MPERLATVRSGARTVSWALALGLSSAVSHAFASIALSRTIGSIAMLAHGDLAQAALALCAQGLLLVALVFLVCAAGGLVAELPPGAGATAGLLAAALPVAVMFLGEGPSALGPLGLVAERATFAVAAAVAGARGLRAGLRLARRGRC